MNFEEQYLFHLNKINEYLSDCMENMDGADDILIDSMRYSILSKAKRIRPVIFMMFYKMFSGKNDSCAYKVSCSIEMVHTYSLIHDDLPLMDNDDMRRGKPSNHIKYGEDVALLAGDALLTMAFENIGRVDKIDCEKRIGLIKILSEAAGSAGMISGQIMDIKKMGNIILDDTIVEIYRKKTGMLFSASCRMGALLADADSFYVQESGKIGEKIGILFQIIDDILDVIGRSELTGKNINSDLNNKKYTFVAKNGLEKSIEYADFLVKDLINSIKCLDIDASFLVDMVNYLRNRLY